MPLSKEMEKKCYEILLDFDTTLILWQEILLPNPDIIIANEFFFLYDAFGRGLLREIFDKYKLTKNINSKEMENDIHCIMFTAIEDAIVEIKTKNCCVGNSSQNHIFKLLSYKIIQLFFVYLDSPIRFSRIQKEIHTNLSTFYQIEDISKNRVIYES